MLFKYWTISFRPSPYSLDRYALGVVVQSAEGGQVATHFVDGRSSIFRRGDLGRFVRHQIKLIEERLTPYTSSQEGFGFGHKFESESILQRWSAEWNNSMIVDPSRLIVSENISEAVALLFSQYVGENLPVGKSQRVSRVRKQIRRIYSESEIIAPLLSENPVVETVGKEKKFDFAVGTDSSVIEISSAFNFAKSNTDDIVDSVEAWTWRVDRIRNSGGCLRLADSTELEIDQDAEIIAAIYPPETSGQKKAFADATEEWANLSVEVVEFKDISRHARELEQRIAV